MLVAFLIFGSLLWFRPFLNPPVFRKSWSSSHTVSSPPFPFPWFLGILWVFTCSPCCFLNAHWKPLVPHVYFALDVKGRFVSIFNLFPILSLLPISFTSSCRSNVSRLLCSCQLPNEFQLQGKYALGLDTTRNFQVETWAPLGNLLVWNTAYETLPEGAWLWSREAAQPPLDLILCSV